MHRMFTQDASLYTVRGMSKGASSVVAGIGFEMKHLECNLLSDSSIALFYTDDAVKFAIHV